MSTYTPEQIRSGNAKIQAIQHRPEDTFSDPVLGLLLLLSRIELSEAQDQAVLALSAQVDDWRRLAYHAERRFVLPLVHRHLRRLAPPGLPAEQMEAMRSRCLGIAMHILRLVAAQQRMVRELLLPLGIPYLLFKGHVIAARYYGDPGLRFYRDVDLLVPSRNMGALIEAALERGYTFHNTDVMKPDRADLKFTMQLSRVVSLVSPDGVLFEIHGRLDKSGMIYDTDELLAAAEVMPFADGSLAVMPTAEHFVYACMHHTVHLWSRLHWLADLDAMQRHPSFDLDAVRACAARRGLTTTVESCLELYRACSQPEPWNDPALGPRGRELLDALLLNLRGDHEVEGALWSRRVAPDFAFEWQTTTAHRLRCWARKHWLRIHPSYHDYRSLPLPPQWHWVYYVTRPYRLLATRLSGRGGGTSA